MLTNLDNSISAATELSGYVVSSLLGALLAALLVFGVVGFVAYVMIERLKRRIDTDFTGDQIAADEDHR